MVSVSASRLAVDGGHARKAVAQVAVRRAILVVVEIFGGELADWAGGFPAGREMAVEGDLGARYPRRQQDGQQQSGGLHANNSWARAMRFWTWTP